MAAIRRDGEVQTIGSLDVDEATPTWTGRLNAMRITHTHLHPLDRANSSGRAWWRINVTAWWIARWKRVSEGRQLLETWCMSARAMCLFFGV